MRTNFSRIGDAWAFGQDKLIKKHNTDMPRIEYEPATGERLGLLIEQGATNEIPRDLSNWYISSFLNKHEQVGLGIDERNTAWRISALNGNSSSRWYRYVELLPNEFYSYTVPVKKQINRKSKYCSIGVNTSSGVNYIYFNPENGSYLTNFSDAVFADVVDAVGWWVVHLVVVSPSAYRSTVWVWPSKQPSDFVGEETLTIDAVQFVRGQYPTSLILSSSPGATTRSADFFDAPSANNEYGPGLHTWQGAVRMSRDPGEPTILGYADGRIYASDGRLHLDGPGTLWQPDGEHAPGDYVPFYWTTQFSGSAPDFSLGRGIGDTDWWNGHLVDIVPYPRTIRESEIRRELGL